MYIDIQVPLLSVFFFFFKKKTAYEIMPSLVGSEMCIRDRYGIKDHHILTLKDVNRRRGSWVLETTEITERYKDAQGDMDAELKKFAGDIATKVKLQLSADYETSDTPSISYTLSLIHI